MLLSGKVAIITGAGSGIGQASAQLFTEEGAKVIAVDVPGKGLHDTHAGNDSIVTLEKDITDEDAPEVIVGAALDKFGKLDILFNNAGVSGRDNAEFMPQEQWDKVMAVNVTGQFRLAKAAIPELRAAGGGRIINTASVMAEGTDFGLAAYCASKAGVAGLTRTLALELGRDNITANYIEPGAIYTGMTQGGFDKPEIAEVWARKSALKRLGEPLDIARGAVLLASDYAAFITGHGLRVDGGLMLRV